MHRLLLCLPVCLCMASDRRDHATHAEPPANAALAPAANLVVAQAGQVNDNRALPSQTEMERLAKEDVIAFLDNCLRRCERDVPSYTATLQKQERMQGNLLGIEVIGIYFRDKPHSVLFIWEEGARLADRALYVEGENEGKMLARPRGFAARFVVGDIVARDVAGPEARQSGRYPLSEFGFKKMIERTRKAWKAAANARTLRVEYLGIKRLKELGDRPCWALQRTLKEPDADGVKEATVYFDAETWLQVGNVLKDENGDLLGAYYFRDVKINPDLPKDQFDRQALRP